MTGVLQGKVAFITGAAQGIGLQLARDFAREGAVVAIADMNGAAAKAAAAELGGSGVACDVTSEAQLVGALDQVIAAHGRIDVLVNNAGLQFVSPIEEFPAEKFELLIRVMLIAPFLAIKHVFPLMKRQRSGRIINMASINGLVGFAGKAAYNSAKHGVIGLTKVAALEAAPFGITVNALCPGYVDTPLVRNQLGDLARTRKVPLEKVIEDVIFPLVPMKKLLSVADVSEYALFLASDRAGGVTGQAVVVDAGYTAQ
ncbi:MAG TPA: 3-hydroxybutyrate dehydrogenase [Anaeromyxobacteraceae bacterium]|nr:3-hydroxybutyrate dehydrogenase [Anaeromyxobacteraceae bacterium]